MTDEQRRKILWLNRAFHAEKLAKALLSKRDRDRDLAQRLTRGTDGIGSSGTAGNGTEDACIRLAETEEKLQAQLRTLVLLRDEIYAAIMAIKDPELEAVLLRRYLGYESMELIAERMHYARMTIHRKHLQALDKLVIECYMDK